jgi:glucosamine 6-phosphate synthetase-like amidotransferase/phosphosugar isomerase protein
LLYKLKKEQVYATGDVAKLTKQLSENGDERCPQGGAAASQNAKPNDSGKCDEIVIVIKNGIVVKFEQR